MPPPVTEPASAVHAGAVRRALARPGVAPAWPAAGRAAALARIDAAGLPDGRAEQWRYTDPSAWLDRWSASLDAPPAPGAPVAAGRQPDPGTITITVIDGRPQASAATLPAGLVVTTDPSDAAVRDLAALADALAPDPLVDLNTVLATGVLAIRVAPGTDLGATPVHLRLAGSGRPDAAQPRLLVGVGAGSRLALVVEHDGSPGVLANSVTQAWVAPDGHLELVRAQCLPDDARLLDTGRVELAAGASARVTSIDLGAALSRQAFTVVLAGPGASATIDGLFLADGDRHLDNRTRVEHRAPATTSRETFRGIADGNGRGVFNGSIVVLPGAAGSNAELSNRNLLLAAAAEIDTKPELEIYVDDVRCSHGATTGQLDPAALFYLRSRGLDEPAARRLLTAAFLRASLAGVRSPALRARLEALLEARLGGTP